MNGFKYGDIVKSNYTKIKYGMVVMANKRRDAGDLCLVMFFADRCGIAYRKPKSQNIDEHWLRKCEGEVTIPETMKKFFK